METVTPGHTTWAIYHHSASPLSLGLLACRLDYFPFGNDRIMSDMFKEVDLVGGAEEASTDIHKHIRAHTFLMTALTQEPCTAGQVSTMCLPLKQELKLICVKKTGR